MMLALYQVSSLYPRYYNVALVWIDKEYKRLVETASFTAWYDVESYVQEHRAILKFDGII